MSTQTITEEQVRHVAHLSRLRLSEQDIHRFTEQLASVLDYMSRLSRLNVDDVEPMAHALDISNVLREDIAEPGIPVEQALANAPEQSPPFFKVVKVLGDGGGA